MAGYIGSKAVLLSTTAATVTGDMKVDVDTLVVDSTNNRVGIGTTSPVDTFHAVGSDGATSRTTYQGATEFIFENNGDFSIDLSTGNANQAFINWHDTDAVQQGWLSYNHNGDYMRFGTGGSERVRIDAGDITITDGSRYKFFGSNANNVEIGSYSSSNTSRNVYMSIDSAGRVTMPYQAAFSAHKNGNQALAAHTPTKITGFSTIFENQSGWNSSTNRYTAPVAGVYLIHFCIQSSVLGGLHVRVDKNGSNGWNGDSYLDYGDTSGGDNTYFAKLNANDYLEFYAYLTSAGNVNANRTRISVVLLG